MTPDALDAREFIEWRIGCIIAAREGRAMPSLRRPGGTATSSPFEPPPLSEAAQWLNAELEKYLRRVVEGVGYARSR